jgi:uncharacterized membrane protein
MSLIKEQRIFNTLSENKNFQLIQIITTPHIINERFEGSISKWFRQIKNGLYSFNGISNRDYFRGISGFYLSLEEANNIEIIIVYDTTNKTLNQIQIITRIRKLLGMNAEVKFGQYGDFEKRIKELLSIKRNTQSFGDYYFNK